MKTSPSSRQTRILVIDDEVGFTRLLKLAASDYEMLTENDPLRAIDTATKCEPDLILLDIHMPGLSGHALATSIKAHPKLREIPIAFVSGTVPKGDSGRPVTHLDGFPILAKPLSIEAIDECVKGFLAT